MKQQVYNELMQFERTIYNILKGFEKQLDNEEFDADLLDYKIYHVTEIRFIRYLQMLLECEYIEGIKIMQMGDKHYEIKLFSPSITLKGLEYLSDNSMIKKVTKILKGGASVTISAASVI